MANRPSHMKATDKYNKGGCWRMCGKSLLVLVEEIMESKEETMSIDNYF